MPAAVLLAIQAAQALLTEFPQIEGLAADIQRFFAGLFSKGVISVDQQNQVKEHVDAVLAAIESGNIPPEFTVEPDPPSTQS